MRLAIILEDIYLYELGGSLKRVLLFEAEQDLVIAIGEDRISTANVNYLCLWLLAKRVCRLYCDGLDSEAEELLARAGIEVRPLEGIRDNPILRALLLDDVQDKKKG